MEADFRRRINNALSKEEADSVRYERYQWECEQEERNLAVVISNSNRSDVQPSKPLADSAVVVHRNAQTGRWSFWDKRANKGQGGWQDITDTRATSILGATIAQ